MASNYNYKAKDCMISGTYSSPASGIQSITYTENFDNVPQTIASVNDVNARTNTDVVSTYIYSPLVSGFSAASYLKDATTGQDGGAALNYGSVNYFSVDNTAIQTYTYKNSPIIKCGIFTIPSPGTPHTVSFGSTFQNAPVVVVCPTGTVGLNVVTSYINIDSPTTTNFIVKSYFKDARSGESGGGLYYNGTLPGTFNYIAVDNTAISTYQSNSVPIIKCGTFTTNTSGLGEVTGLGFPTGATVRVFCNPTGNNTIMISCCFIQITTEQFQVYAFWKDGTNNGKSGGAINNGFNYIAIRS